MPCSDDWLTKIQPWVDQWEQADEHLVHPTGPHTDSSFRAYLTWYLPRTRARLVFVDTHPQPHQARPQDGYARHHVEALAGAVSLLIIFAYIYRPGLISTLGMEYLFHTRGNQSYRRTPAPKPRSAGFHPSLQPNRSHPGFFSDTKTCVSYDRGLSLRFAVFFQVRVRKEKNNQMNPRPQRS